MLEWSTTSELNQLRKVPERDVWLMHPAIVNAWYSPNHNTISKMWFSSWFSTYM
jgi:predicted metalloendopeptidase